MNALSVSLIIFSLVVSGCAKPRSAWLVNPLKSDQSYSEEATMTYNVEPKAEILFVIDNSGSMREHIANVSKNIDSFVNNFSVNNPLKYNLAVTSVYDSRTFDTDTYRSQWGGAEQFYALGQFRFSKNRETAQPFVSSGDDNLIDRLKENLSVGVQELPQGGPQYEELFSPVAAIYGLLGYQVQPELSAQQQNFFLGDDSYKILFFVTDASDASPVSPSELYYSLVEKSGGDRSKVMAFAAMVYSNDDQCKRDPGARAYKLEEFLNMARQGEEGSNSVSLCDDFGQSFDLFGKSIRQRTLSRVFPLKHGVPVINNNPDETLRVFYGNQEIPLEINDDQVGFRYNPTENSIWLNPQFQYEVKEGAKLCVQYTAISVDGISTGLGQKKKCVK